MSETFIAICPYCHKGKVKAAESAIGQMIECRHCKSSFMIAKESWLEKSVVDAPFQTSSSVSKKNSSSAKTGSNSYSESAANEIDLAKSSKGSPPNENSNFLSNPVSPKSKAKSKPTSKSKEGSSKPSSYSQIVEELNQDPLSAKANSAKNPRRTVIQLDSADDPLDLDGSNFGNDSTRGTENPPVTPYLSMFIFGVSMSLSQLEFGKIPALVGLLSAFFVALIGIRHTWFRHNKQSTNLGGLPVHYGLTSILIFALSPVVFLLAFISPKSIGFSSWKNESWTAPDDSQVTVLDFDHATASGNGLPTPASPLSSSDPIHADRAIWQQNHVQVFINDVFWTSVELTNQKSKFLTSKKYLVIKVVIKNKRLRDSLPLSDWATSMRNPSNSRSIELTNDTKQIYPEEHFEGEWKLSQKNKSIEVLPPTKMVELTFVFDLPDGNPRNLNLKLSGNAVGGTEPIRFWIPGSMIVRR